MMRSFQTLKKKKKLFQKAGYQLCFRLVFVLLFFDAVAGSTH